MSYDYTPTNLVDWFTITDGGVDFTKAAFDHETQEVFVDVALAGDPRGIAKQVSRNRLPVLHNRRCRYAPAGWLRLNYPDVAATIDWVVAEVHAQQRQETAEARHE